MQSSRTSGTMSFKVIGPILRFMGLRGFARMIIIRRKDVMRIALLREPRATLEGVTRLDFSARPNNAVNVRITFNFNYLRRILPNLTDLDLSHAGDPYFPFGILQYRGLTRFTWKGCTESLTMYGNHFSSLPILSELYLDGACFYTAPLEERHAGFYMFMQCRRLECLSIKNASEDESAGPLSQDVLIQMVRSHPTLRWLRSDLTEENIAMLQQERPDITLVRE